MVGSNLLHVMTYHDFYQLLKRCCLWVPAEFVLCFGWVAPEVDDIGWTIECFAYGYNYLADEVGWT